MIRNLTRMQLKNSVLMGTLPLDLTKTGGGVESVCVSLLDGFRELNELSIDWLAFSKEVSSYTTVHYSEKITLHYIPIRYPRMLLLDFFLNRKELKRILRERRPDIVHVQGAAPHLLRLRGISRRKIVVTQHGIMSAERKLVNGFRQRLKFAFKYFIERYYFPRFRNIVFISDYNKKLFPLRSNQQSALIRNPVNRLFFEFFGATQDSRHGLRLIYIGWISRLKNLGLLLEALVSLKQQGIVPELTIVGSWKEPDYRAAVEKLILENGLGAQLRFTGPLSSPEVALELSTSDVLVMPSLQENSPVSIAEAMAMGKVVVASDVGAISEMLENGVSGLLFEKGNCTGLARLLAGLHNNPNQKTLIGGNARERALRTFSPGSIAAETASFYKRIIS